MRARLAPIPGVLFAPALANEWPRQFARAPKGTVKILLVEEDTIRLEPTEGQMTIEAPTPDRQYSPFHMLASALAYCTFSVLYSWASHANLSIEGMQIDVSWKFSTDEPKRVSDMSLSFKWPSLPPARLTAAKRVAALCTVHETLLHPPAITIEGAT
jgi:uncharacterized OsmC-like protein